MKNRRITIEECALAYELRREGCCWKRIALGLGIDDAENLASLVNLLVRQGFTRPEGNPPFTVEMYRTVIEMRQRRARWDDIAAAVGFDRANNLASLFYHHHKNGGVGIGRRCGRPGSKQSGRPAKKRASS